MSFLLELWTFIRVRRKYVLIPVLLILLIFGGLLIIGQGSALAPFIYTLF